MSNRNFIERALDNGFERLVTDIEKSKGRYDAAFNPKNGWMGVVVYHPVEYFKKGDKTIEMSLERYGVTDTIADKNGITKTKINERHIRIYANGKIVYENHYGVMPPKEIEEMYLWKN